MKLRGYQTLSSMNDSQNRPDFSSQGASLTKRVSAISLVISLVLAISQPVGAQVQQGDPMKEFVLSASYGVLAGTLVGASSLAFSDRPGDNLNKVARGASLGLYGGIILGLFILYGGSSGSEDEGFVFSDPSNLVNPASTPRFNVYPLLSETGSLEGARAEVSVLRF